VVNVNIEEGFMTVTLTISGKPDDEGSGIVVLDSSGVATTAQSMKLRGSREHQGNMNKIDTINQTNIDLKLNNSSSIDENV
jgi:hypothetical protein